MTEYTIKTADNGWIVSWWGDEDEQHSVVFAIPDDFDRNSADPQALVDLLYFVKEEVCGQRYSKHKIRNAMIRFEGGTQ